MVEMKKKKYLAPREKGWLPLLRGENTFLIVSGDSDQGRPLTNQ
jgi:hypothetical protein